MFCQCVGLTDIFVYYEEIRQYKTPKSIQSLIKGEDVKIAIFSDEIDTRPKLFDKIIGRKNIFDDKSYPIIFIGYNNQKKQYYVYLNVSAKIEIIVYPVSLFVVITCHVIQGSTDLIWPVFDSALFLGYFQLITTRKNYLISKEVGI